MNEDGVTRSGHAGEGEVQNWLPPDVRSRGKMWNWKRGNLGQRFFQFNMSLVSLVGFEDKIDAIEPFADCQPQAE